MTANCTQSYCSNTTLSSFKTSLYMYLPHKSYTLSIALPHIHFAHHSTTQNSSQPTTNFLSFPTPQVSWTPSAIVSSRCLSIIKEYIVWRREERRAICSCCVWKNATIVQGIRLCWGTISMVSILMPKLGRAQLISVIYARNYYGNTTTQKK